MPGPEAKTEYHWLAFFASVDLPKLLTVIFVQRGLHAARGLANRPDQLAFMPRYSGSS